MPSSAIYLPEYLGVSSSKLAYIFRRRKWQPTPVFLPRESHEQGSLAGYNPWGHKESNTIQQLHRYYIYICVCVCVCVNIYTCVYIYVYIHKYIFLEYTSFSFGAGHSGCGISSLGFGAQTNSGVIVRCEKLGTTKARLQRYVRVPQTDLL